MKTKRPLSFHSKLLFSMLAVSLLPLLLCNVLLLNIFRFQLGNSQQKEANLQLRALCGAMDTLYTSCQSVCDAISSQFVVSEGLKSDSTISTQRVYRALYDATDGLRESARFDLYDADGVLRYSTTSGTAVEALNADWGVLYAAAQSRDSMVVYNTGAFGKGDDIPLIRHAKAICTAEGSLVGYITASVTKSHLDALFQDGYDAQNAVLLLDPHWQSVYSTGKSISPDFAATLRSEFLSGSPFDGGGSDFFYTVMRHTPTGYCFLLQQPMTLTQGVMRLLYIISAIIIILCFLLCIFLSLRLSRQFFTPINTLYSAMGKVEGGNLDVQVEMDRQDELGQLSQSFNHMTARLKNDMQCLLQRQKELNEAQLRMMQAQLNPHFLGNTLDTMKWLAKIRQVPEVALMATDLADILRFSISAEELVTLQEEVDMLLRYIDIQKIRFHGKFDFVVTVPEALQSCVIPKLMLQPLVENAIIHGLQNCEQGRIAITVTQTPQDELCITVEDDGQGISPEMLERFNTCDPHPVSGHLGLYNVHSILRNYYGAHYGLRLNNGEKGGACITAVLPLRRDRKDAQSFNR